MDQARTGQPQLTLRLSRAGLIPLSTCAETPTSSSPEARGRLLGCGTRLWYLSTRQKVNTASSARKCEQAMMKKHFFKRSCNKINLKCLCQNFKTKFLTQISEI